MSTFLITGGSGFIGSHLVETAIERGHRVIVLDDLSSGSIENLSAVRSSPRLEFIPESVLSNNVLAELVDRADLVFHLAATVGVFNIIESPVATILNNISGTEAVLKMAAKKKKKVLITSTSEVYGKSATIPFQEDGDLVLGPTSKSRWSYAATKIVDEFLALAYWREYAVPTVVVRLFNCVGPRQVGRYGMVLPRFIQQALNGDDLTVYGSGKQARCFCYVSDVVEALFLLAQKDGAVGQVVNIGNPQEVTIEDLARRVIAVTEANVGLQYIPYESAYEAGFEDMERRVPDIRKLKEITGFEPTVGLDEALLRTLAWFRAQPRAGEAALRAVS